MDANKWPFLVLPEERQTTMEVGIQKSQNTKETSDQEVSQTCQTSAPRRKSRKGRQPDVATRASNRIPKSGGPILEKATRRMHEKDELLGGNTNKNPFTVLNNTSNHHLNNVI